MASDIEFVKYVVDQVSVAGREFIGEVKEAPPYPGAKNSYLIDEQLDDREWLTRLIRITEQALPTPKPRRKKKKN